MLIGVMHTAQNKDACVVLYSLNMALVFISGKVYYNTRDQERISKIQLPKRSAKIMKFFDGLVAARMMELDGERVEGQVRNARNARRARRG